MPELNEQQQMIARTVRDFVEREVIPVAAEMEHRGEYPHALVETMKSLGLFGLNVPDGIRRQRRRLHRPSPSSSKNCRAAGWALPASSAPISVLCDVLVRFGTEDQKQRFLPRLAKGEPRGGICLSEPNAGTDLQAITTTARRDGDTYYITGSKMWVTNGRHGQIFLLLAKTDPAAAAAPPGHERLRHRKGRSRTDRWPRHRQDGLQDGRNRRSAFREFPVPAANLIGGVEGQGFKQVMTGLEAERLNVAARGLGVARAAFEEAISYAQQRHTFGKPIAQHQTIQIKLADMATKIEASRLLIYSASAKRDRGERCDLEAGMAKLFATETAAEVSLEAMRIMGGNGFSKDFSVERYYRDAPLLVIGGGTNELQRLIIARQLLQKYSIG